MIYCGHSCRQSPSNHHLGNIKAITLFVPSLLCLAGRLIHLSDFSWCAVISAWAFISETVLKLSRAKESLSSQVLRGLNQAIVDCKVLYEQATTYIMFLHLLPSFFLSFSSTNLPKAGKISWIGSKPAIAAGVGQWSLDPAVLTVSKWFCLKHHSKESVREMRCLFWKYSMWMKEAPVWWELLIRNKSR